MRLLHSRHGVERPVLCEIDGVWIYVVEYRGIEGVLRVEVLLKVERGECARVAGSIPRRTVVTQCTRRDVIAALSALLVGEALRLHEQTGIRVLRRHYWLWMLKLLLLCLEVRVRGAQEVVPGLLLAIAEGAWVALRTGEVVLVMRQIGISAGKRRARWRVG